MVVSVQCIILKQVSNSGSQFRPNAIKSIPLEFLAESIGEQAYLRFQTKDVLIAMILNLLGRFLFGLLVAVLAGRPTVLGLIMSRERG